MADQLDRDDSRLGPYVPKLLWGWSPTGPDPRHMRVTGSLAFVDISGFTRLTERLSRRGKVGAEEMSDILDATFAALLHESTAEGGDLVKWGGDAVLLLFRGSDHALRAARAADRMRATMRRIGRIETASGAVVLRMSAGVHSGELDFFLVGDPEHHRELLVTGPGASATVEVEAAAEAGQIGLSAATAALLPTRLLGDPLLDGRVLRRSTAGPPPHVAAADGVRAPWAVAPVEVLSPPLRAHLLGRAGEAEHRAIAVGFVQFSGSDRLLADGGPGALAAALDELVRHVQHACAAHEVTFFETDIDHDGGKILLTAGTPSSADHPEERMLRVAREVLDRHRRLPVRIGVNRGHVFAGDFGPPWRRTYSVKGDAINLAARLLGRAAPGQALATVDVFSHSQTVFRTLPLPPFSVKGKSRPVHAAVLGALVGLRVDSDLDQDLVSRHEEMRVLVRALEAARSGRGRVVEVVGDPGIGKTRLVNEMLRNPGVRVFSARCEAYEASTAYFPFRKLLRDVLGLSDDPVAAQEQLPRRLADLAPALLPWTPLLGIPLDLTLPATPETADLDPQFLRPRLETVVVELLTTTLSRAATALVVEDTHHIDEASADLLRRLGAAACDRPWLVVVTHRGRPGAADAESEPRRTTLRLGPLDEQASVALARRILADHPLTPHAMQQLARRSGGNPLFLGELVRSARRSGDVSQLPDTVEALIASDIDRLSPADRRALRCAAVLGAVVDERALDLLLAGDGGLGPDLLHRLEQFLVRGRSGRLRFRSVLLRDVAYEGLPYRRRRMLHDQAGRAIERDAGRPESSAEVLSLHFFHAGNQARAWRYSVAAGRRALEKHAHGDAIPFLERAAQAAPQDGSVIPHEHAAVFEQLADSRFTIGLTTEATAAYAAARRLVRDDPVRQAFLVEKEVRVDVRRRRFPQAMRRLSRGLHALDGVTGSGALVARSLLARRYAYIRFSQGRVDEALRWAERAAGYAEEAVDKGALAQAYEVLNAIHAGSGRPEPFPYGQLALQANRELGDLPPQGHCLNNLAVEAFSHGRWEEALREYRRAAGIFRRIGDTASEVNAAYNQAELLVRQGRFTEAAELLPEVLLVARAVEDDELVALAMREQAWVLAGMGDLDAALAELTRVRELFDELGEESELVITDLVRAELLAGSGEARAAERILEALRPPGGPAGLGGLAARWHRLSALVQTVAGSPAAAREELLVGLESAALDEDRFEQALLLRDLVGLARLRGEPEDPDIAAQARELLDSMGVLSPG